MTRRRTLTDQPSDVKQIGLSSSSPGANREPNPLDPANSPGRKQRSPNTNAVPIKNIFLNSNNYSTTTDVVQPDIEDLLRARTASYWTPTDKQEGVVFLRDVLKSVKPPLRYDFETTFEEVSNELNQVPSQNKFLATIEQQTPAPQTQLQQPDQTPAPQTQLQQPNTEPEFLATVRDDSFAPSSDEFALIRINEANPLFKATKRPDKLFDAMINGGTVELPRSVVFDPAVEIGKWYEDHTFESNTPYSMRQAELTEKSSSVMYAKVDPTYNFYIQEYEDVARQIGVQDQILPNIYAMISETEFDEQDDSVTNVLNPAFRELTTLQENIRVDTSRNILLQRPSGDIIVTAKQRKRLDPKDAIGQYFDMWGRQYQRIVDRGSLESLANKYSNLVVTHNNVDLVKNNEDKKELFPMFVDIEFSTTRNTPFSNLLEQTDMSALMFSEIINGDGRYLAEVDFSEVENEAFPIPESGVSAQSVFRRQPRTDILPKRVKTLDVYEWLNGLKEELETEQPQSDSNQTIQKTISDLEGPNAVYLGDLKSSVKVGKDKKYAFYKSLVLAIFSAKLAELVKDNTRTYQEIVNGKLAATETVFYRIEKRSGGPEGPIIQNIFLPNSSKIDVHKYIDTQVKYGKRYTYNIFAYDLVYGTRYRYVDYKVATKIAGFDIETEPSLKIVETPYFTYTNTLLDSPPVSPDVNVIPYRGVNNMFKIAFNSNVGRYEQFPVTIEQSEAEQIRKLLASQDRYSDEKLVYESDDQATEYEIWRMEKRPTSYKDFSGKKVGSLVTDIDLSTPQKPTSGAFIEKVEPNKKYWYTFRSIDVHGNISYPSPIYEIELVDDSGAIYPIIKVVDFAPKIPKMPLKTAKRLLHIVPKLSQTLLNEEASGLEGLNSVADKWNEDNFQLGVAEEVLWGKKFKIRLTSKKTGKKVDLNIAFDHEHIKIKPE